MDLHRVVVCLGVGFGVSDVGLRASGHSTRRLCVFRDTKRLSWRIVWSLSKLFFEIARFGSVLILFSLFSANYECNNQTLNQTRPRP